MRCLMRAAAAACALTLTLSTLPAQDAKTGADKPITDADFVIKAASGGMFEVESSKLAQTGASRPDVKKFAEMMVKDHTKANTELMAVAKKAGVGAPTKMLAHHQKMIDQIKAAKGSDLDRVYMDAQVKAHDEAVMLFSNAAKSLKNPDLKAFAEKTLPTLKEHQEHAKKHAK